MTPDLPDRYMELNPDGTPRRVLHEGSTIYEDMIMRKVRTWFVGEDDLAEPERQLRVAREVLQEIVRLDDKCKPGLEYDSLSACGEVARDALAELRKGNG